MAFKKKDPGIGFPQLYYFTCDTPDDVASLPVEGGPEYPGGIAPGSYAEVISDGSEYKFNCQGKWVKQPGKATITVDLADVESDIEACKTATDAVKTSVDAVVEKLIAAPATEEKQDAMITFIDGIEALISTLDGVVDNIKGDTSKIISPAFSAPVTGVATATATAAEIFAGASRLPGRRKMLIKNEETALRARIGGGSVTQQNGFPLEPGAVLELDFEPAVSVPVYAISEGFPVTLSIIEY